MLILSDDLIDVILEILDNKVVAAALLMLLAVSSTVMLTSLNDLRRFTISEHGTSVTSTVESVNFGKTINVSEL